MTPCESGCHRGSESVARCSPSTNAAGAFAARSPPRWPTGSPLSPGPTIPTDCSSPTTSSTEQLTGQLDQPPQRPSHPAHRRREPADGHGGARRQRDRGRGQDRRRADQRIGRAARRSRPLDRRHRQPGVPAGRRSRSPRASRRPTSHLDTAAQRFLWTFIAAVAMFIAGAFFAIGYGVYQLLQGGESTGFLAAYVTLGISLVAEGASWLRARRQIRREAARRRAVAARLRPLEPRSQREDGAVRGHRGAGRDRDCPRRDPARPAHRRVGVRLGRVDRDRRPPGHASRCGWATTPRELLIGAAARPDEREALERALSEFEQVDQVVELLTMALGPNSLLVAARIDLAEGLARQARSRSCRTGSTSGCARSCPTSPRCSSTRPLPPPRGGVRRPTALGLRLEDG